METSFSTKNLAREKFKQNQKDKQKYKKSQQKKNPQKKPQPERPNLPSNSSRYDENNLVGEEEENENDKNQNIEEIEEEQTIKSEQKNQQKETPKQNSPSIIKQAEFQSDKKIDFRKAMKEASACKVEL